MCSGKRLIFFYIFLVFFCKFICLKVENLLSENLRLNKDVKDLNAAISEEKKKKSGTPTGAGGWRNSRSNSNDGQLEELQTELNTTRIKLIERERDFERWCNCRIINGKVMGVDPGFVGTQGPPINRELVNRSNQIIIQYFARLEWAFL